MRFTCDWLWKAAVFVTLCQCAGVWWSYPADYDLYQGVSGFIHVLKGGGNMCSSEGRDGKTICEGGVTAHQSRRLASIQGKTRPVLWWGISLQLPQAKWCPNWWALLWYCLHIRSEKEDWKYNPASERMKESHRQHLEKNGKTKSLFLFSPCLDQLYHNVWAFNYSP